MQCSTELFFQVTLDLWSFLGLLCVFFFPHPFSFPIFHGIEHFIELVDCKLSTLRDLNQASNTMVPVVLLSILYIIMRPVGFGAYKLLGTLY